MRSLVEFQFYQGIIDKLAVDWYPETFYTLAYGTEKKPSYQISEDFLKAAEPFIGHVASKANLATLRYHIDRIVQACEIRREILIWTDERAIPWLVDGARVVNWGYDGCLIRPILDRTAIMNEVMKLLDLKD